MVDEQDPDLFQLAAAQYLVELLRLPRLYDALPLPIADDKDAPAMSEAAAPNGPARISTHAQVLPLLSDTDWNHLHQRFARLRKDNLKPWFRCIGLLRGLDAKSVVVETYYVCLDYKSEYASFYAHLDAPRQSWTVRLHFFAGQVSEDDVVDLTDDLRKSYLGYIVCREGDLPLVGRCMIALPSYLTELRYAPETSAIVETVNFYGQRLSVRGVPFMQQDQRFAMCAHVAVWTLNYSAYRRGTVERRLIADLVGLAGSIHPLRPRTSDGLSDQQVATMLSELGFRTTIFATPNLTSAYSSLPRVQANEIPDELATHLGQELEADLGNRDLDVTSLITTRLEDYVNEADESTATPPGGTGVPTRTGPQQTTLPHAADAVVDPEHPTIRALHGLLDYLVTPYVRSGWPVYCGTSEHALVLCGRAIVGSRPVHFVHDDQCGPYLLTDSLPTVSRDGLRYQSGFPVDMASTEQVASPPIDRVLEHIGAADGLAGLRNEDMTHAVLSLVLAVPARVLLPAGSANRHARVDAGLLQRRAMQLSSVDHLTKTERENLQAPLRTSVSIVMGIDYKKSRRAWAQSHDDREAVAAFSSVQLSEWVIVVEGLSLATEGMPPNHGEALWEFVYDASSSELAPRLQLARFLGTVATIFPRDQNAVEVTNIRTRAFPQLSIPARIGKVSDDDRAK